ncbi:Transposase IS116/IS110/IS902 family protein [Nonomuraea solani]|uniref:Transposase IS116/IS110/IS902 family protein n=1 Tax=Nonomuraea solani TaxID=1144553 RepID=A0A1H6EZ37_9ACTN|nr:IS110 family transposase [Nonomuraea solani]SEH02351.1 Transposase IS116/IS110/IS902 family protein [Nonomuraea solani]
MADGVHDGEPDGEPEEILARVAAIDVGKDSGMVCTRLPHDTRAGRKVQKVWEIPARHDDILALGDHLRAHGVERVVIESTSDYWRIFYYLLEAAGLVVWLVNAREVRNVPGRPKTDKLDAVWLCKLNERGMLRPSFVPPAEIRDLRQLTRLRTKLGQDAARHMNRIEKVLEDALLKISVVLSDLFGTSGRRILNALVAGQRDPARLAELADYRVRASPARLRAALTGRFRDVHAVEIGMLLELIGLLEAKVADLDDQIAAMVADLPGAAPACGICALVGGEHAPGCADAGVRLLGLAERLDEITGVGMSCAQVIIAELGTHVTTQFPTAGHAAAWAKLVPVVRQSGKTSRSGPTGKGNRWLRGALGTAAMATAKSKGTFLGERYQRIRRRRGKQKAMVAVGRSILEIAYLLIANPTLRFHDLGADYYDRLNSPEQQARRKIREIERLTGKKVHLVDGEAVAS